MKLVFVLVVLALAFTAALGELSNSKVLRTVDLTTQFARHNLTITVENKGTATTSSYLLAVQNATNLAYIRVDNEAGAQLDAKRKESKSDYDTYEVALSIEAGKSAVLKVYLVYFGSLEPYPKEITQGQKQLVRYYGNTLFFSPYPTAHQRTTVKLSSTSVEGHSEKAPTKVSGDTLTYGAYENVKPFTHELLWVHFENNAPFLTVVKMVKDYEVSHWGNLAVEQWLDVHHTGASLKGQFSRFDFQRNPGSTPSAVLQITEILPLEAADVYYRDDIGNISTSTFTVSPKGLEFHIVPRFPLFGGWKNNWYTGYNLPLHNFLNTDGGSTYLLNVPFASNIGSLYIEDYTVKVILPEGAKVTKVSIPFDVEQRQDKHFTYLDTTGRTVVVLHKNHVVPEHNVFFQIEYQFSALSRWFEPLLIAGGFFFLLVLVMFCVRFQLSIKPIDATKTFQRRDELIVQLKSLNARVDSELTRQNAIAEKSTEATYKWNQRPLVLEELNKLATQASPLTTGESFSTRVKDYSDAQLARFKYQGKLHALRFAQGAKKTRAEKEKKIQDKLRAANDTVQQFVEDWIAV